MKLNMKKMIITESDLLKMVNKVLNEQEDRQFGEDEIDLLHLILERELKPPFRKGEKELYDLYPYYNRDGERIGYLESDEDFTMRYKPCLINIKYKICSAFGLPYNTSEWWVTIYPHLKSWLENQLNVKLNNIYRY